MVITVMGRNIAGQRSMGLGEYVFAILKVPSKGGFTERVAFE